MTSPVQASPVPLGAGTDGVPAPGIDQPVYSYGYVYEPPPKGRFGRLMERMPRWASPAGVGVLLSGGVAYTLLMKPTTASATDIPTCVVKLFTGFDCPGCGGTRAAWYLLHGDIPAAAHHHAMLVFAAPFLAYLFFSWAVNRTAGRRVVPKMTLSNRTLIGFLIAWLVFSVVRNLPWAPFTWMFV